MDGWKVGQTQRHKKEQKNRYIIGQMDGRMDGRADDSRTDARTHSTVDGWMDIQNLTFKNIRL